MFSIVNKQILLKKFIKINIDFQIFSYIKSIKIKATYQSIFFDFLERIIKILIKNKKIINKNTINI